jgi:hypothetical protein
MGQNIRLLVLHSGKPADPIRCDIVHVNILSHPVYEAVSYTWATENGDCQLSETIIVGGRYISVTANCLYALWRLRKVDAPRTLWLDAISINQEDVSERNHQVGLMREIYSNASSVLIYIGELDVPTQEILRGIWQMNQMETDALMLISWRSLAGNLPISEQPTPKIPRSGFEKPDDFARLKVFFSRRWFSRASTNSFQDHT